MGGTPGRGAVWGSLSRSRLRQASVATGEVATDRGRGLLSRFDDAPRYPLLALKNIVVFPHTTMRINVGTPRSLDTIEEAMGRDAHVIAVSLRDNDAEKLTERDFYEIGTLCRVKDAEHEGGYIQVALEGIARVRISGIEATKPCYFVRVADFHETGGYEGENRAMARVTRDLLAQYGKLRGSEANDLLEMARAATDVGHLADVLNTLVTGAEERQSLLSEPNKLKRLERVAAALDGAMEVVGLEARIKERVREQIDKNQREYYLREQLKAIHDELGESSQSENDALRERIEAHALPDEVKERLRKELGRLERMTNVSAEATVVRTYLETVLSLPWTERSVDRLDLDAAEATLNAEHDGLEHVKERVLDFLAVRKLRAERGTARSMPTILCLMGPPGVGKTSLGRSIAKAMDRKFVRVSLGGVRDEAEIRGHRRTYVGAFPGRIVQGMKQAGTMNPVMLLDEIDKMSNDFRGDPAAALLEVLDPEQNAAFTDHYLDLPYDLSDVLFVTTGNYIGNIPRPLKDRMEIIELGGYTEEEKLEIAAHHLLPRQAEMHGLEPGFVEITPVVVRQVIREYTREAGVRNLERMMGGICRKAARLSVSATGKQPKKMRVTAEKLAEFLGPPRYGADHHAQESHIGVVNGLAVTEAGGELLSVEVATMPGTGAMTLTGRASEVMQESAKAAQSYARSRALALKIDPDFQRTTDIHIHIGDMATPKDGPSAGVTMVTALVSALTKRPVRHDLAMTGEISLRGRVMAIGGLKEKVLAAHRAGIRTVIAPAENRRDAMKIPKEILRDMRMVWVEHMDAVIAEALVFAVPPALPEADPAAVGNREEPRIPLDAPSPVGRDVVIAQDGE